jgi:hypothetical protein
MILTRDSYRNKPKLNYKLIIPKGATSPTGSIYKLYDIVKQERVLVTKDKDSRTLWSQKPFTVRYKTAKGKVITKEAKQITPSAA